MPVTPIAPVTAPIIIVNSTPKKSEAEIMKDNGGHIYFSVHLKHCEECRAEEALKAEQCKWDGLIIFGTIGAFALGFIILIQWQEIKEWFSDRVEAFKKRNNPWYEWERNASRLYLPDDYELVSVDAVNYLSPTTWEAVKAGGIPIIVRTNELTHSDHLQRHERFIYRTSEASFFIFKRWTIRGYEPYGLRLPFLLHSKLYSL